MEARETRQRVQRWREREREKVICSLFSVDCVEMINLHHVYKIWWPVKGLSDVQGTFLPRIQFLLSLSLSLPLSLAPLCPCDTVHHFFASSLCSTGYYDDYKMASYCTWLMQMLYYTKVYCSECWKVPFSLFLSTLLNVYSIILLIAREKAVTGEKKRCSLHRNDSLMILRGDFSTWTSCLERGTVIKKTEGEKKHSYAGV